MFNIREGSVHSVSLQSETAAAKRNAESEMGSLWMNNVALNEAAAFYHQKCKQLFFNQ